MAGNSTKVINCKSCGAPVQIRAAGRSLSVVCGNCTAILDPNSPEVVLLGKFAESQEWGRPRIPLGQRGKLGDVLYECVGFVIRSDRSGTFSWSEYLLFNPYKGFRWLVENNGHWSFVKPITDAPPGDKSQGSTVKYGGQVYELFTSEPAVTRFVMGEFYWRVEKGETCHAVDFISPPYMLSYEITGDEVNTSLGEYIEPSVIKEAFKVTEMPHPFGVAPNQVNKYEGDRINMFLLTVLFGLVIWGYGLSNSFENAITFTGLVGVFPLLFLNAHKQVERERWSTSDFAPAIYQQEDDGDWGNDE